MFSLWWQLCRFHNPHENFPSHPKSVQILKGFGGQMPDDTFVGATFIQYILAKLAAQKVIFTKTYTLKLYSFLYLFFGGGGGGRGRGVKWQSRPSFSPHLPEISLLLPLSRSPHFHISWAYITPGLPAPVGASYLLPQRLLSLFTRVFVYHEMSVRHLCSPIKWNDQISRKP